MAWLNVCLRLSQFEAHDGNSPGPVQLPLIELSTAMNTRRAVFQATSAPPPGAWFLDGCAPPGASSFLLTTQHADGSWLVRTRAFPVQRYFESGFRFDRYQWISAAGTGWRRRRLRWRSRIALSRSPQPIAVSSNRRAVDSCGCSGLSEGVCLSKFLTQ
jgi:hypothetical protein